jgi:hypothetical protein
MNAATPLSLDRRRGLAKKSDGGQLEPEALGLTVPNTLLAIADEVIEADPHDR